MKKLQIQTKRKSTQSPACMVQLDLLTHKRISELARRSGWSIRYLTSNLLDWAMDNLEVIDNDAESEDND